MDIKKALAYLRGELARVNRVIEVYEAIADENYQTRRRKAVARAGASDKPHEALLIPPPKVDRDMMLWLQ